MPIDKKEFAKGRGQSCREAIGDFLLAHTGMSFDRYELARETGFYFLSVAKVLEKMEDEDLVESRVVHSRKYYRYKI